MIKANEFRAGNLIYEIVDTPENPFSKEIFRISSINEKYSTLHDIDENITSIENCEPIKLTEEWLLKAKLTQTIKNTFLMGGFELIYDSPNERYNVHTFRGIICVVRYVHQLQNLYFCLCGEELVFSTEP